MQRHSQLNDFLLLAKMLRVFPLIILIGSAGLLLGGCFAGGGHHGGGLGSGNALIDVTSDVTVDNQPDAPNLSFTDGTNATLHFTMSNSGNKPSDQAITVTVGPLPNGLTYVSYASVTSGAWTCTASGQTITCTSSSPVPGLTNAMPTFTMMVSVANTASGNAQLPVSTSTPDGQPSTSSGAKGVNFNPATPSITSLNPTSGPVGTSVTIAGSNFGSSQGSSSVTFNGTSAGSTTSWSATSITVKVPTGATTGNVLVTVSGVASNGVAFTVTTTSSAPAITNLNPNSGPVGTAVIISGSNFGSSQGSTTVTFNGTTAGTATSWSATSITVNVPTGATTGNVVVTVGGTASNGVTFTVTTTTACASGGNAASLLTGDYAFLEQGFLQPAPGVFVTLAGRLHADGVSTISNGLVEYNSFGSGNTNGTPVSFTGCFVLNASGPSDPASGTMTLVNSTSNFSLTLAIVVHTNGNGRFVNFQASSGIIGSGHFEKQCPHATNGSCPSFADSNVSGDYGFGFHGFTTANLTANAASAGRFTASGTSLSAAVIDISSSGGVIALNDPFSGSYSVTDTANGRVEITSSVTYNNGSANGLSETFHFACYIANVNSSGKATVLYCLNADTPSGTLPLLSGKIIIQNTPSGGWTNANAVPASGASVLWGTGIDGSGTPRTNVGQVTYNVSASTVTVNQDLNKGGSSSFQTFTVNASVAANGRESITNPANGALISVVYVLAPGKSFALDEANNASLSFIEPQEAQPTGGFTLANFDNSYTFGTVNPIEDQVTDFVGVATATGSTGTLSGNEDVNSSSSGTSSPAVAATYAIASSQDAAIGRVTVTVTSPSGDTLVLYIIDANAAVAMSTVGGYPAIIYLQH